MKARHVLIIHTVIFVLFVLGSLSSPILAAYFPNIFSSIIYLVSIVLLMVGTIVSWNSFGGCPFTVWENRLRVKESKETYLGSCLPYYSEKWLGLKLPNKVFTAILVALLILPIVVGLVVRY